MTDPEARKAIQALAKDFGKISEGLRLQQQQAAQRQAEAAKREAIDSIVQIQGKLYERATAYVNLILLGGFAGVFTVWTNTRDNLPAKANVCVGLALGLSLVAFISFEIYKMVLTAVDFMKAMKLIKSQSTPENFMKELDVLKTNSFKPNIFAIPIWISAMFITIVSALIAGSLLFYNYMALLAGWTQWPS